MKKIILFAVLLLATPVFSQSDYELQELTIDVQQPITNCELSLIIDDIYYPIEPSDINGSIITLHLVEWQDYLIVLNGKDYLNISLLDREVIDEKDLSISADVDYQFDDGILVFNYTIP